MTFPIALVVVLVLAAFAMMPKKSVTKAAPEIQRIYEPEAVVAPQQAQMSLREQQVAEESTAVADIYRRMAHDQWMTEIQAKAANMMGAGLEDA